MYVGGGRCGLWKTTDGGTTWAAIGVSLPTMAIAAIAIDPSNPSQVYVATDNQVYSAGGGGVFRSSDDGANWVMISGDQQAQVIFGQLIVDPTNPSTLYLASRQGVRRSIDAGATWQLSLSRGPVTGLVQDPTNTSILYAAISGVGIFKTTTGGQGGDGDWTRLVPELSSIAFSDIRLALCGVSRGPGFPSTTLYASVRTVAGFQIFSFNPTDTGVGWGLRSTLPLSNLTNHVIGVDQTNPRIVYTAGKDFYRSTDEGDTFSDMKAPHVDHHGFASDPLTPSTIYTVCDGGIYRSSDRGNNWTFIGGGITNVWFYDIAVSMTNPNLVIGGTQDNGTLTFRGASNIWRELYDGDGGTVAIDPTNEQILYAMNQDIRSLVRSTDGGANWSNIGAGLPMGCISSALPPAPHWQVHPTQPATLLASCKSLWRSISSGSAWSAIFTAPDGDSIIRSAVDPTDLYYAASARGQLFAGVGGSGWNLVFVHPNGRPVLDLCIDPVHYEILYATFDGGAGGGTGRVFRLVRSGSSAISASDITTNLPGGLRAQAIAVHPRLRTVFVGTDRGAWQGVSPDGGTTWVWKSYNYALPPADVSRLIFSSRGLLRAGTFGRGVFEVFVGWAG
jgi:photosystem II stability/assembly factor-like uncharacterized protein